MILVQIPIQNRLAHVEDKVVAVAVVGVAVVADAVGVAVVVMGDVVEEEQEVAVQVAVGQCNLN